jgi:multisubunit Na+/H+ antiporter MnhB subunit
MLVLAPGGAFHGTVWYVSTMPLTGLGFYMGSQTFGRIQRDAPGVNPGFIGLIANVLVLVLVSLASQRRSVQPTRFELQ